MRSGTYGPRALRSSPTEMLRTLLTYGCLFAMGGRAVDRSGTPGWWLSASHRLKVHAYP